MVRVIALTLFIGTWLASCAMLGNKHLDKQEAMATACAMTPYSCGSLDTPKVVYEEMREGLQGWYGGGDTIYINEDMRGTLRREVLLHETIHYLQVMIGGAEVPGYAKDICALEEEAFRVTDEWLDSIGRGDMKRGPNWWGPYSFCHRWYNPRWTPRVTWGLFN